VAVRTCDRGVLCLIFLHEGGMWGARSVARERHLELSMVAEGSEGALEEGSQKSHRR
jgi:hypothetical protein